MDWPGEEYRPIVIQTGRPARNRPRLYTDHALPNHQTYYTGPDGQLLVPAGGHQRASSVSGQRPAQVIINNDNAMAWDDHSARRPRSVHRERYYEADYDDHEYVRERSRSRRRRESSPHYEPDFETKEKLKELEIIKKHQEDKELEKKIEDELLLKRIKQEAEAAEKAKEEKELKKKAVEEYKQKEEEEKQKKKKQKEKEDEEFKERMRKTLWANGYSEEQIDRMLKKAEKKESGGESSVKLLAPARPTHIKVHWRHLDPDTLDAHDLPWEWDNHDPNYIIIKQWISEAYQDKLFDHTRKLRETKQIAYTTTELKKERDQLLLVRKKEPRKKSPVKLTFF